MAELLSQSIISTNIAHIMDKFCTNFSYNYKYPLIIYSVNQQINICTKFQQILYQFHIQKEEKICYLDIILLLSRNKFAFIYKSTIYIWIMKKKKISKLLGHRDQVVCLYQHEGNLISGSHDHTIRIWDLNSEICIKVIRQELTASGIYPDIEGIILHSNGYLYLFTSNNISKMNANTYTIEDTYQITYTSRLVALKHK